MQIIKQQTRKQEGFCFLILAVASPYNQVLKAGLSVTESTIISLAAVNLEVVGSEKPHVAALANGPRDQSSTD